MLYRHWQHQRQVETLFSIGLMEVLKLSLRDKSEGIKNLGYTLLLENGTFHKLCFTVLVNDGFIEDIIDICLTNQLTLKKIDSFSEHPQISMLIGLLNSVGACSGNGNITKAVNDKILKLVEHWKCGHSVFLINEIIHYYQDYKNFPKKYYNLYRDLINVSMRLDTFYHFNQDYISALRISRFDILSLDSWKELVQSRDSFEKFHKLSLVLLTLDSLEYTKPYIKEISDIFSSSISFILAMGEMTGNSRLPLMVMNTIKKYLVDLCNCTPDFIITLFDYILKSYKISISSFDTMTISLLNDLRLLYKSNDMIKGREDQVLDIFTKSMDIVVKLDIQPKFDEKKVELIISLVNVTSDLLLYCTRLTSEHCQKYLNLTMKMVTSIDVSYKCIYLTFEVISNLISTLDNPQDVKPKLLEFIGKVYLIPMHCTWHGHVNSLIKPLLSLYNLYQRSPDVGILLYLAFEITYSILIKESNSKEVNSIEQMLLSDTVDLILYLLEEYKIELHEMENVNKLISNSISYIFNEVMVSNSKETKKFLLVLLEWFDSQKSFEIANGYNNVLVKSGSQVEYYKLKRSFNDSYKIDYQYTLVGILTKATVSSGEYQQSQSFHLNYLHSFYHALAYFEKLSKTNPELFDLFFQKLPILLESISTDNFQEILQELTAICKVFPKAMVELVNRYFDITNLSLFRNDTLTKLILQLDKNLGFQYLETIKRTLIEVVRVQPPHLSFGCILIEFLIKEFGKSSVDDDTLHKLLDILQIESVPNQSSTLVTLYKLVPDQCKNSLKFNSVYNNLSIRQKYKFNQLNPEYMEFLELKTSNIDNTPPLSNLLYCYILELAYMGITIDNSSKLRNWIIYCGMVNWTFFKVVQSILNKYPPKTYSLVNLQSPYSLITKLKTLNSSQHLQLSLLDRYNQVSKDVTTLHLEYTSKFISSQIQLMNLCTLYISTYNICFTIPFWKNILENSPNLTTIYAQLSDNTVPYYTANQLSTENFSPQSLLYTFLDETLINQPVTYLYWEFKYNDHKLISKLCSSITSKFKGLKFDFKLICGEHGLSRKPPPPDAPFEGFFNSSLISKVLIRDLSMKAPLLETLSNVTEFVISEMNRPLPYTTQPLENLINQNIYTLKVMEITLFYSEALKILLECIPQCKSLISLTLRLDPPFLQKYFLTREQFQQAQENAQPLSTNQSDKINSLKLYKPISEILSILNQSPSLLTIHLFSSLPSKNILFNWNEIENLLQHSIFQPLDRNFNLSTLVRKL
ncbi:hypothetical protein DLAC_03485 [Tieghemostelium lacteum]|uniref:Uncharacterized protein n=1 Tax=Tieghemostelium lacteum TaxID=361077 RepID=A0A152A153_TIELA|nr:hypothetical protein DLAC_03485 [Tieghemostelium lacteum]|eukprot:KYQ99992.1 hypothetical protein DLAC_03485 [Tieghemostelium lacteum]